MIYGDDGTISKSNVISIFVILFVSVAVFKVLMRIHEDHFELLQHAAYSVLEGRPHWIAYQNRLLGPFIVLLISKIGLSYSEALRVFILITVVMQNFLLYYLLRKMFISGKKALTAVLLYSFAFLLVQHGWFYTWDSIDAITFTLFAYGIVKSKSLGYFVPLFCIELLNRESALFIALYLLIDSFQFNKTKSRLYLVSKKFFFTGSVLILIAVVYIKIIRNYLFMGLADNTTDLSREILGNHVNFIDNLQNLFFYNLFSENITNTAFILGSTTYLFIYSRLHTEVRIKALLVYCAILLCILIFGLINETRMYIALLPFLFILTTQGGEKSSLGVDTRF